jgi:hypothetical protein
LAICEAFVFLRAIAFSSRSSLEVHARRFFFLFAITPPWDERASLYLQPEQKKSLTKKNFYQIIFSPHTGDRQTRLSQKR